jgi:hypothetical protein
MAAVVRLILHYIVLLVCIARVRGDATQQPLGRPGNGTLISQELFWELEELARIVDISYCVGTAGLGIQKPFKCASHCGDRDFDTFELVTVGRFVQARCRLADEDVGMEHWTLPVRLLRLHRPLALYHQPSSHTRLPRNVLGRKHHRRPLHHSAGVRAIPRRRRRRRRYYLRLYVAPTE